MTTAIAERTLPHNLEAERALLGAALLDRNAIRDAEGLLTAQDFYRRAHQIIFAQMLEMSGKRVEIDLVTLKEALTAGGSLEDVGGPAYIAALVDGRPHSAHVEHYADIVRKHARLRDLIYGANKILAQAYEAEDDAEEILAGAERTIIGLADRTIATGFESIHTIAQRGLDFIEQASQRREPITGIPSGLSDLDAITRGFQPGTLVTIGARPGVGKSSLLSNIAQHAALQDKRVGVFSLEMSKMDLFIRHLAAQAHIDSHRIQTGFLGERDWGKLSQALGEIAESPMHIDETPAIGLLEVRSRARRLKAEYGLDILVIDYLQLMSAPPHIENRALAIGAITSALKALSKELQIPILIASQLSRDPEKGGRRPRLSDLRDSGSIEADSDLVMLLHRNEDKPQDPTELIIAKHRNGDIGTVHLEWIKHETRYDTYRAQSEPVDTRLPMGDR